MAGVIAGSSVVYIPKELPEQDRKILGLEGKVAGASMPSNDTGKYKLPRRTDYTTKY